MPDVFILPDKLDTAAAPGLLAALRAARGAPLTLDASHVAGVGAICAQILASAHAAWMADGHALRLKRPAGAAADLTLLGLASLFDEMDQTS